MAEVLRTELPPGTLLNGGRYVIDHKIGAGGFGITYEGHHSSLNKKIAIKEFFLNGYNVRNTTNQQISIQGLEVDKYDHYRQRFINEARTLAALRNEAIVKVEDIFDENGTSYMVMEFVEGRTLQEIVESEGPMEYEMAVNYVVLVCEALAYIHSKNILHRDVTPNNIIVTPEKKIVLIDFGSARRFVENKTQQHTILLTRGYAPLEQRNHKLRKGAFTDLYSLGGVFYYLLTGQQPIDASERAIERLKEPIELNPNIPPQINAIIMKAMEMNSADRYQTAQELIDDIFSGEFPKNYPPTPSPSPAIAPLPIQQPSDIITSEDFKSEKERKRQEEIEKEELLKKAKEEKRARKLEEQALAQQKKEAKEKEKQAREEEKRAREEEKHARKLEEQAIAQQKKEAKEREKQAREEEKRARKLEQEAIAQQKKEAQEKERLAREEEKLARKLEQQTVAQQNKKAKVQSLEYNKDEKPAVKPNKQSPKPQEQKPQNEKMAVANSKPQNQKASKRRKLIILSTVVLGGILLGLFIALLATKSNKNSNSQPQTANVTNVDTQEKGENAIIDLNLDSLKKDSVHIIMKRLNDDTNDPAALYVMADIVYNYDLSDANQERVNDYWNNILVKEGDVDRYLEGGKDYTYTRFAVVCAEKALRNLPKYNYDPKTKTIIQEETESLLNTIREKEAGELKSRTDKETIKKETQPLEEEKRSPKTEQKIIPKTKNKTETTGPAELIYKKPVSQNNERKPKNDADPRLY